MKPSSNQTPLKRIESTTREPDASSRQTSQIAITPSYQRIQVYQQQQQQKQKQQILSYQQQKQKLPSSYRQQKPELPTYQRQHQDQQSSSYRTQQHLQQHGQTLPELSTKSPIMHADEGLQQLKTTAATTPHPTTNTTTEDSNHVEDNENHLNEISLPETNSVPEPKHGNSLAAILNNEIISNEVVTTERPFDLNLKHNKVLTREHYDREERKKTQTFLVHREKLKKIIEDKEKKLQLITTKPTIIENQV